MESKLFRRVPTEEDVDDLPPNERWRIWKNVLVLGFAFMLHFTAFWGASNLQSSINAELSLGTFTLAAIYASLIVSNIFLPVIVIKLLGCKWTTSIALIAYMPFIAAQFYPRFFTLIPAGLAVGLGGGPLWCAKCTYLSIVAENYAQIAHVASDMVVTRFFGVFFMFYQLSQVWGNLISSAVLSGSETFGLNVTSAEVETSNECGAMFNPSQMTEAVIPNLTPPPQDRIHLIAGIYLVCMITACLIVALFLDPLTRYTKTRRGSGNGLSGMRLLAVTMKQLQHPYQLLLLPITMFIGAEQAFLAADYTASFVACGWAIEHIGYVMICFGISNAICALATGAIAKIIGRTPLIILALLVHVAVMILLQIWVPTVQSSPIYFVVAAFWGLADAIWLVQINSLYGILFPGKEEASYSNFRLWEATGSVVTYAYSPYLRTGIKIYLLLALLLLGVVGYATIQVFETKKKQNDKNDKMIDERNKITIN